MSSKPNWDFAKQAVESIEEEAVVVPGRVAPKKELQPVFGVVACVSCGASVDQSHFICPECGGSVRGSNRPQNKTTQKRTVNAGGAAVWSAVVLLAVITFVLLFRPSVPSLIDPRFSVAEKDSIKVGMSKAEVEAELGKPTTVIVSIADGDAVQWVRGTDESLSSITVRYSKQKVKEVSGTNLR